MATNKQESLLGYVDPYQASKGEEYMSEAMREHFVKILEQWKRNLMEEVDRTVSHMKEEAANFADPADRATQEEEFSLELRTRDRERKLIKKIDKTLEAIENDDYGFCETCGIEIGLRRLEARPTATQCVDAKHSTSFAKNRQAPKAVIRYRGRFAPSATGPLHLGSIFAALISYIHAKHNQGEWLIRIDDLDEKRCKQTYVDSILECLNEFELKSSEPVRFQTDRTSHYAQAFNTLETKGLLYSCDCTRNSLPGGPYPGFCRHRIGKPVIGDYAVRIDTIEIDLTIDDQITEIQGSDAPGDFIIRRRDGLFAYQLISK